MGIPAYIRHKSAGTITISGDVGLRDKKVIWYTLFSNYDIRFVQVNDHGFTKEYIIERGSHTILGRIEDYMLDENRTPLLEVGSMCNISKNCRILVDGEHTNKEVINMGFTQFPCRHDRLRNKHEIVNPITTNGKTGIGNAVLLGRGATILSGVAIGHGAVIGANAIVTKDVPPFAIAVGSPAKIIGYRFDGETIKELLRIRWWDFQLEYLFSNLLKMQNMKVAEFIENFGDTSKNKYVNHRNRFVFSILELGEKILNIKCIGCDFDRKYVPFEKLNKTIQFYVNQFEELSEAKQIHSVDNIFGCEERG